MDLKILDLAQVTMGWVKISGVVVEIETFVTVEVGDRKGKGEEIRQRGELMDWFLDKGSADLYGNIGLRDEALSVK